MFILLTTCALLVLSMTVHLVLWKIRRPHRELKGLFVIFTLVPCLGIAAIPFLFEVTILDLLRVLLLYATTGFSYILTYPAIGADSPTISLMEFFGGKSSGGVTAEEATEFLVRRPFVKARLRELLKSGQIIEREGVYLVSGKGSLVFRIILTYRKIYGTIPRGG